LVVGYFDASADGGLNAQYSVVGGAGRANFDAFAGGGVNAQLVDEKRLGQPNFNWSVGCQKKTLHRT